jgi:hypothetical protein
MEVVFHSVKRIEVVLQIQLLLLYKAVLILSPGGWVGGWVGGWTGGWVDGWVEGLFRSDNKAKLSSSATAIASWN